MTRQRSKTAGRRPFEPALAEPRPVLEGAHGDGTNWIDFSRAWRRDMIRQRLPLCLDSEIHGLRNTVDRAMPDFG